MRAKLAQIEDRVAFNVPIRDQQAGESDGKYAQYVNSVKLYRHQMLLWVVGAMGLDESSDDWDQTRSRLDF